MIETPPTDQSRLLLHAPNVHTGGGLTLLSAIVRSWPSGWQLVAWLDERVRPHLELRADSQVKWVRSTPASRLVAEFGLKREAQSTDCILCFHGLPPLFAQRAPVYLFQQNRTYLGGFGLGAYRWKTRQRLRFEQFISRALRGRVAGYWVQTPSMLRAVSEWYGPGCPPVWVLPFMPPIMPAKPAEREWDFVYVADGEGHKNHRRLVAAWSLLADQGCRPSLALTLSQRDVALRRWIEEQTRARDLRVVDLGQLSHDDVLKLYSSAGALVFPSLTESLGLPLVEARESGLPIVASELDFVRDVCEPAQTFDPRSEASIARAVKRFMNQAEPPCRLSTPHEFLDAVMTAPRRTT